MSDFFQPCGSKPFRTEIDLYRSRVVPTAFSMITSLQDLQQETAHSAGAQFLGCLPWQQLGDSIPIQSVTRSPTACSLYILYSGGLPGFKPVSHPIFKQKKYTKGHCAYTKISTLQAVIKESSPHFPSRLQHPWHPAKTRYAKGGTSGWEKLQQLLLCLSWQKKVLKSKHQHFSLFPASSPFLSSLIISNYSILPLNDPHPIWKVHLRTKPQNQPLCKQGLEFLQRSERDRATLPAQREPMRKETTNESKNEIIRWRKNSSYIVCMILYEMTYTISLRTYHTTLHCMISYHIIFYQYYTHYKSSIIDIPSPVYKKIYFAGLARCCCFAS